MLPQLGVDIEYATIDVREDPDASLLQVVECRLESFFGGEVLRIPSVKLDGIPLVPVQTKVGNVKQFLNGNNSLHNHRRIALRLIEDIVWL